MFQQSRSRSRQESHGGRNWRKDSPMGGNTVLVRERDFDPYKPPRMMREATRKPVQSPPPRMKSPRMKSPQMEDEDGEVNVIGVLRLLTAMEEHLGSLGPRIIDMLSQALALEKAEPNAAETLLDNEVNCVLIETVKEKLKGLSDDRMGMVNYGAKKRFKIAITKIASLMHFAAERKRAKDRQRPKDPIKVPGIGTVDKSAIAKQIANALIMQGKTDVTTMELEQLIDAVVGMAQASHGANKPMTTANFVLQMAGKPSAADAAAVTETVISPTIFRASADISAKSAEESSVSALQMLQGAYSAEMAANSMDGLSDSDLQTLLQNFKDLSTEEQHGLITYLKKLEAKEPARVERLRKFVNLGGGQPEEKAATVVAAASGRKSPFSNRMGGTNPDAAEAPVVQEQEESPKVEEEIVVAAPAVAKQPEKVMKIDSDDEEYTFEDVFKAASNNLKAKEKEQKEKQLIEEVIAAAAAKPTQAETNLMDAKALIANIIGQFGNKTFNSSVVNLLGLSPAKAATPLTVPVTASKQQPQNASGLITTNPLNPNPMQVSATTATTVHSNQPQPQNPLGGVGLNLAQHKPVQYPIFAQQQQQQVPPQQQNVQYPTNYGQQQQHNFANGRALVGYPQQGSYNRGFNQPMYSQQQPQQQNPFGGFADYSAPGNQQQQQGQGGFGGFMAQNNPGIRAPGNVLPNNQFQQHPPGGPPRNQQPQNFQQFGGNRNFYG